MNSTDVKKNAVAVWEELEKEVDADERIVIMMFALMDYFDAGYSMGFNAGLNDEREDSSGKGET